MRVESPNLTADSFKVTRIPKELLAPVLAASVGVDLTFRDALAPLYPNGIPRLVFMAIKGKNEAPKFSNAKFLAATSSEYWQFATGKMNKEHGIAGSNILASLRRVQEFADAENQDVIAVAPGDGIDNKVLENVFAAIWEPQNQKLVQDLHTKALGLAQPAKPKPEVLVVPMEFA